MSLESLADSLAGRCEAFECFGVRREGLSAEFEAGRLKSAMTTRRSGVGLRVVRSGRLAAGGTADPEAVQRTVESTLEAAAFGEPCNFQFAGRASAAAVDICDPAIAGLRVGDLVAAGRAVVDRLADLGSQATVNVSILAGQGAHEFVNSAGQRFDFRATRYSLTISVEFFGQDDIFSIWEYRDGCRPDVNVEELESSVRRKFEHARTVVQAGSAGQPIIFSPHGLSGLLEPLLAGLDGQNVADGVSPLADKRLGPAILDERLTLVDDGTLSGRAGSAPFDAEGVPTQRTVLVDRGRVANFMLDLRTAGKLGLRSTGNAARDLASPPSPENTNLVLVPGDAPLDQMISDVDDGLLVDYLLGVGQGNIVAGDYSNPVGLAFKIRSGRIVGRVKNCSLAGNVYQDLASVSAVEDRGYWYGSTCLPHVRIDGLRLATGE